MSLHILTRPYTPGSAPPDEGWTDFGAAPNVGTVFYVSSSDGSDSNDGLSTVTPKETLAAAMALLTEDQDDWILMKRGDVFPDEGSLTWDTSGPAGVHGSNGYQRLGAYGTGARPRLLETTIGLNPGFASSNQIANVAFSDVFLDADARLTAGTSEASSIGVNVVASSFGGGSFSHRYILFENMRFRGHSLGISVNYLAGGTSASDFKIRRCAVRDLFAVDGASEPDVHGFFLNMAGPLEFEDCFGYRIQDASGPGTFSGQDHFVYDQGNGVATGEEARSYVGAWTISCPDTVMQRSGGVQRRCFSALSFNTPGIYGHAASGTPVSGGCVADMSDSLWIDPAGSGITLSQTVGNLSSGTVDNCMGVRTAATSHNWGIFCRGTGENSNTGTNGVTFSNNWLSGVISPTSGTGIAGNTYTANDESNGAVSWTIADIIGDIEAEHSVSIGTDWDDVAEYVWLFDRGTWDESYTSTAWINAMRVRESLTPITA